MPRLISSLNDIMFNNRNIKRIRLWYMCYLYAWIYLNITPIITTIIRPIIRQIIRPIIRQLIRPIIRPIIRPTIRKWTCALIGALTCALIRWWIRKWIRWRIRKCLSCYVELWSYILFWLYIINKTQSWKNLLMPYL